MSLTFNALCTLLEGVEKISNRRPRLAQDKEKLQIQKHIEKWFANHRHELDDPETPGAAVLSAIFPHRRKDRVYGLQTQSLSRKLEYLMGWNDGKKRIFAGWRRGALGDLGRYVELASRDWDGTFGKYKQQIPIARVDALLTKLAARSRFSDPLIRRQRDLEMNADKELQKLLKRLESWEQKWLVRLLLREYTTIVLDEYVIFREYHFLLPDLLKFQNDFDAAFGMLRNELAAFPSCPAQGEMMVMRFEAAKLLKPAIGVKISRPQFSKAWSMKHCIQMVDKREWLAEVKYDGEYCEIHVDLENIENDIKIFSKNGKDATRDRESVHDIIRQTLRLGKAECPVKRNCVILAEMVLYSDREEKILPFSKIRKHISRSGSWLGTLQDSLPHEWEHLMLVFFDVLVVDDQPVLRKFLPARREVLKSLIIAIPGRSMRSCWTKIDGSHEHGIVDLKQAFARSLAERQEGLILKPLDTPYFPLASEPGGRFSGYFIKLKKDYLSDMGGQRDLGDFAIIGAHYDPQVASKTDVKPLHWTHFYLGCVDNTLAMQRLQAKPRFKVVGCLGFYKCIPKADLKHLNQYGLLQKLDLGTETSIRQFDIEHARGYDRRMTVAFRNPFVVEVLGSGYEKPQNESFEMLRHPRVTKIHHDRTWEDTVTMEELKRMAEEKWEASDVADLEGHARDVVKLVRRYSDDPVSQDSSERETTQETTQRTSQPSTVHSSHPTLDGAVVEETQQTSSTSNTIPSSQYSGSTQGTGVRASREVRSILVRQDTSERLGNPTQRASSTTMPASPECSPTRKRSLGCHSFEAIVSPPPSKRRNSGRNPLEDVLGNNAVASSSAPEKLIHTTLERGLPA